MEKDNTLIRLSEFRDLLKELMVPEVLNQLATFIEDTEDTSSDTSMLEKYRWFCENAENGPECRYAKMAKNLFYQLEAKKAAKTINWLYHNFGKKYE